MFCQFQCSLKHDALCARRHTPTGQPEPFYKVPRCTINGRLFFNSNYFISHVLQTTLQPSEYFWRKDITGTLTLSNGNNNYSALQVTNFEKIKAMTLKNLLKIVFSFYKDDANSMDDMFHHIVQTFNASSVPTVNTFLQYLILIQFMKNYLSQILN